MRTSLFLSVALLGIAAACSSGSGAGADSGPGEPGPCSDGERRCAGSVLEVCGGDAFTALEECAQACDPGLGCVVCQPGSPGPSRCEGDVSQVCAADGSGYEETYCDPMQGMACNLDSGRCTGACSPGELGESYIGCEYYPTVTSQIVGTSFPFAVAVANTSGLPATVLVEGGALTEARSFEVPAGSVQVETLPWVPELKLCADATTIDCFPPAGARVTSGGAYRLRSTQPVTVYQFSPLDYAGPSGNTFSNDASLLLPATALTGSYVAAAWPRWNSSPGLLAVTATEDGTTVSVETRAEVPATGSAPAFAVGTPESVTLNRGDVLQLLNASGDLTGTIIAADKPVQTIGGHHCTNVPLDITACDHLEESMFPVETLSREYLITAPAVPAIPDGKEEVIRIVATTAATTLTFDPPLAGVPTTLEAVGDFVEIARQPGDVHLTASQRVLVAQYMEGQQAGGGTGDPALALAVATDQYRRDYAFHAPTNYEVNYVNVTARAGTEVLLDGEPVTGFTPVGNSGWEVARVVLGNGLASDGNHSASSSEPFGISVYGYGQYTSYWYPGGLDLARIPVE